jgi:hypothetical protein
MSGLPRDATSENLGVCGGPGTLAPQAKTGNRIGKPGGGPTQFKGSRGHSGDAQLH